MKCERAEGTLKLLPFDSDFLFPNEINYGRNAPRLFRMKSE